MKYIFQNIDQVYDNSIERASLAAHRDFGGPAEQRWEFKCSIKNNIDNIYVL